MDFTRDHEDPYVGDNPPLVIDRQRIIHAAAFRRLQHKTQVFVTGQSDHYRSRLTHTLEVASLARSIAEALGASAELAEVVALAHDLGHPPFGHAGERALQKCMKRRGEHFEHNEQTLRLVTVLEHPYPEFRGLNLTHAARACLRSHTTRYDRTGTKPHELAPLEGQVVAQADQLAYASHDLQDGLYAGLLDPPLLMDIELWRTAYAGPESPTRSDCLRHLRPTVERIQAILIEDLKTSFTRAEPDPAASADAAPAAPVLVELSAEGQQRLDALAALLHTLVYRDQDVARLDAEAAEIVGSVFEAFVADPRLMPARFARRVAEEGELRVAADYVSGMTDRFCREEHARLRAGGKAN
jgi:dGTPase